MNAADKEELKLILSGVLEEKNKDFYIDREQHYEDHMWLHEMIKWSNEIKSSVLKCIVKAIVVGVIALLITGFLISRGN